jgi:hypothetical protein
MSRVQLDQVTPSGKHLPLALFDDWQEALRHLGGYLTQGVFDHERHDYVLTDEDLVQRVTISIAYYGDTP